MCFLPLVEMTKWVRRLLTIVFHRRCSVFVALVRYSRYVISPVGQNDKSYHQFAVARVSFVEMTK